MPLTRDVIGEINKTVAVSIRCALSKTSPLLTELVNAVVASVSAQTDDRFKEVEKEISTLRPENQILRELVETKNDANVQYSRRNTVRIFRISETDDEIIEKVVISLCNEQLKLDIQPHHIDRQCHRTSVIRDGRTRLVLVKFVSYKSKQQVMRNKKLLKGGKISVLDDFTRLRLQKLTEARKKYGKRSVWTFDGCIYDGSKFRVFSVKPEIS